MTGTDNQFEHPVPQESIVYCTMVLNDEYLPGAKVVSSQLRRIDPSHKIVCLATKGTLSESVIFELGHYFDRIWFVDTIDSGDSEQLKLLNRPELRFATTKLHLWDLPYSRVIYLDADTLPLLYLNDLLNNELEGPQAVLASPDCGWPDLFNSGVLSLNPDKTVFNRLLQRISYSIDGSDQGVLNQELTWQRVPFLYNVTVNTTYEYLPAYQRFKDEVKVLHFIGPNKPWQLDRSSSPEIAKWWKVYDTLKSTYQPSDSKSAAPHHDYQGEYDENNVIEPDPERWDAKTHAPFPKGKPEAVRLFEQFKELNMEEQPSNNDEFLPHKFPILGSSIVKLPFEENQTPAERVFR